MQKQSVDMDSDLLGTEHPLLLHPIPCRYTLPVTAHPGALSQQLLRRSWPHYHRTARFHDARLLVSDLFDCIPCRCS